MKIRDQHLKACKNKAIKFVKQGAIEEAIVFLEKELIFFKQTKSQLVQEKLEFLKSKRGSKSQEELLNFIKSLN